MLLYGAGSLQLCFDFNFLSIAHGKLAGKPFHAINLEMVEICLFRKNVLLHIRTARQNNDLIQAVSRDQGSKLWKDLIQAETIKFYRRYVDDTLVLVKPCDIPSILKKFSSFEI